MTTMIRLDREREVRFNTRAIIEAETVTGKDLQTLISTDGLAPMRALLWAGLRHEDRQLSINQIDTFMDTLREEGRLEEVPAALRQALIEAKFLKTEDPNEGG